MTVSMGTVISLVGLLTVGAVSTTVWVTSEHREIRASHVRVVEYREGQQQLQKFLEAAEERDRAAEERAIRREIRQLDNAADLRSLSPGEKAYRRELTDQLRGLER